MEGAGSAERVVGVMATLAAEVLALGEATEGQGTGHSGVTLLPVGSTVGSQRPGSLHPSKTLNQDLPVPKPAVAPCGLTPPSFGPPLRTTASEPALGDGPRLFRCGLGDC